VRGLGHASPGTEASPLMSDRRHQLIGAEVSYYTGKVRAYLRYKGIPFDEVAATREVYRDVIVPRTGVRFIPVLITDDDVALQDSSAILQYLERRYPERPVEADGPVQELVALLFDVYADEWLLLPAMHYRWNVPENRAFAIEEFGRLSAPGASADEQRAIGEKLSGPFAGALPALGIDGATQAAIEASYHGFLAELECHLTSHAHVLGGRPSLADFALLGPLYAHLYRDPASGRLMKSVAPRVAAWVERMNAPDGSPGELLSRDAVPETIGPLLARMFREFGPVLASSVAQLAATPAAPGSTLPRAIGMHSFRLEGVTGRRAIFPFNLWRWQRAQEHYQALSRDARSRADRLLETVGGLSLIENPLPCRLERVDNRLRVAD